MLDFGRSRDTVHLTSTAVTGQHPATGDWSTLVARQRERERERERDTNWVWTIPERRSTVVASPQRWILMSFRDCYLPRFRPSRFRPAPSYSCARGLDLSRTNIRRVSVSFISLLFFFFCFWTRSETRRADISAL